MSTLFALLILLIAGCTSGSVTDNEGTTEPDSTSAIQSERAEPSLGELLWSFKPGAVNEMPYWVSPLTSAIVADAVVYVGASNFAGGKEGSLHALDASDGSLLWSYNHNGHTPSTPTAADGVVYFGSEDHNIYAVGVAQGDLLWAVTTDGHVRSKPAVSEETVFAISQDGNLYALDASQGMLRWRLQVNQPINDSDSLGTAPSSPAADDGGVFIVGNDRILRAVDALDGTLLWEFELGGQVVGDPAVADGVVYVGALDRKLYALHAADGHVLWSHQTDGGIQSTPLVEAGKIFVGSAGMNALDALTGELIWRSDPDPENLDSFGSPAVEDRLLYVASYEGQLYVLDKEDGSPVATHDVGENIGPKAPAVANGVMYVVTKDRFLHAIRLIAPQNEEP